MNRAMHVVTQSMLATWVVHTYMLGSYVIWCMVVVFGEGPGPPADVPFVPPPAMEAPRRAV